MLLITGASGRIARRAAAFVAQGGYPLRLMTRTPQQAPKLTGVEVVRGDFAEPATLPDAFTGISAALVVSGSGKPGERARLHRNAFEAAVRAGGVDLRAQRAGAVRKLAGTHPPEKIQALGGLAIAPRAVAARFGERAAVGADLVGGEVARIGFSRVNQRLAKFVELSEIVRRVEEPVLPVEPQPVHVVLDRIHVLGLFLERVRIVEAEVARSPVFARDAEVQADRLGMADVKVAVRLGGEARSHAARVLSRASVLVEDLADEVLSGNWRRGFGCVVHGLLSVRQALSRGGPRKPGGAAGWSDRKST